MLINTYTDPAEFLHYTRTALEMNEPANGLMLGVGSRLVHQPEQFKHAPCLKTVSDEQGLILAAMMTPPFNLILYAHRDDHNEAVYGLVDDLIADNWAIPGVVAEKKLAKEFSLAWANTFHASYQIHRQQRLHALRQVRTPPPPQGFLRLAEEADSDLVAAWAFAFQVEALGEGSHKDARELVGFRIQDRDIYLWEVDGRPVSVAMKTRPVSRGISIALVYTPPELRRRGYATACVGELSRTLLESGFEYCSLFTDLANPTSNHIYRIIGYEPVGDYDEYRFSPISPVE